VSKHFTTGMPKWNVEMRKTPFGAGFRYRSWSVETLHHKNAKMRKTPFGAGFRYRELEESRVETLHHRSPEVVKCEMPKSQNRHINKDSISEFQILGVGGVKDTHDRIPET
jgi:hypothetical protein